MHLRCGAVFDAFPQWRTSPQARIHGGYPGAVPLKLCGVQKICFKIKTKIWPFYKCTTAPQTLKTGYGPVSQIETILPSPHHHLSSLELFFFGSTPGSMTQLIATWTWRWMSWKWRGHSDRTTTCPSQKPSVSRKRVVIVLATGKRSEEKKRQAFVQNYHF